MSEGGGMSKTKVMNRSKYWRCPYFKWDGEKELSCECGRLQFPDANAANDYMTKYCASAWKCCTLARAQSEYYEKEN